LVVLVSLTYQMFEPFFVEVGVCIVMYIVGIVIFHVWVLIEHVVEIKSEDEKARVETGESSIQLKGLTIRRLADSSKPSSRALRLDLSMRWVMIGKRCQNFRCL
jgi:hypothetical protein